MAEVDTVVEAEGGIFIWDRIPPRHGRDCHQKIESGLLKDAKNLRNSSNLSTKVKAEALQDK